MPIGADHNTAARRAGARLRIVAMLGLLIGMSPAFAEAQSSPATTQPARPTSSADTNNANTTAQNTSAQNTSNAGVTFHDLERATTLASQQGKVVVIFFSAEWCGWCERMKATTFTDPAVKALASRFTWAKVDIDEQPQLAATFNVQGVPAMRLLNQHGELLTTADGYQSPAQVTTMLREYADKADAPGETRGRFTRIVQLGDVLQNTKEQRQVQQAVAEALDVLADGNQYGRARGKQQLLDSGKKTWSALAMHLTDDRLAVRAAAYSLLREATDAAIEYDPFAPADTRRAQAAQWRQWIVKQTDQNSDQGSDQIDSQSLDQTSREPRGNASSE